MTLTSITRRATVMTHTDAKLKINVNGQLVRKLEWKPTDGWTDTTDRISFAANAVGKCQCLVADSLLTACWTLLPTENRLGEAIMSSVSSVTKYCVE